MTEGALASVSDTVMVDVVGMDMPGSNRRERGRWLPAVAAFVLATAVCAAPAADAEAEHRLLRDRYVAYLVGTSRTFAGRFGADANARFLSRLQRPVRKALAFDFAEHAGRPFRALPGEEGYAEESSVYSAMLQQYLPALAFGYCVKGIENPYYRNADVLRCYLRCLNYLHGRGVRAGMTFHYNENRMLMRGAPRPPPGAGNLVEMELRMGSLCQSVLLMEPHIKHTDIYPHMLALVRHLEMLGRTSGHVRYYEPFSNPPDFACRVQSDAIQNYGDTTLVSALLEPDPRRREELLREAQRVFTDSLKVIPGWADTIKPDFVGYHHRGIYGNAYTGGFIPQAAFGIYVLRDTRFAVDPASVANLKRLILTYRLYCQKYAMPFGIRGRMPLNTGTLKTGVFPGILICASELGLDDAEMKPVFARLWHPADVGLDFLFTGGRGKLFRGFLALDMLRELVAAAPAPEPDPSGFWYKPYGGLAIHRRDDWMAAVKGYSAFIWDYETGKKRENVYGQYFSHGTLTLFSRGDPVSDIASGYNLREGWDWYRMPGATAVHFPVAPQGPLAHRRFSRETFLGAASCDGQNGVFGMILNQERFADGTWIGLRARKSVFFVDDLIVLLGSGICGGDGEHAVETTLFQSYLPDSARYELLPTALVDPAGNSYHVPSPAPLKTFRGLQHSFHEDGRCATRGHYAVAWFDHGLYPTNASYEAAIRVRGGDAVQGKQLAPGAGYRVFSRNDQLHGVTFPAHRLTGYCFYDSQRLADDVFVQAVSAPCLLMLRSDGASLQIGLANPDLGLVDRADLGAIDFKFVNEGDRPYSPSRPRVVTLTLKGTWGMERPVPGVAVVPGSAGKTALRFAGLHGMDIRVSLRRVDL